MLPDNGCRDIEAQAEALTPLMITRYTVIPVEQIGLRFKWNTRPGVLHFNHHLVKLIFCTDDDLPIFGRILYCVRHKICDYLDDPVIVGMYKTNSGWFPRYPTTAGNMP